MDKYLKLAEKLVLSNIDTDEYAVFMFGSRALQKGGRGADIDIGILGTNPISREKMELVRQVLEESLIPYIIDLVDFSCVNSDFKKNALKKIQIWNQPKHIVLK